MKWDWTFFDLLHSASLMQHSCISPFLQWNETIKLFRGGMPLRRHWANFRYYDFSFTGSEAVDYLHRLLKHNDNFGPEVTRYQTLQLLRKFLKAHVIEDIKGRHGTEDFEDNSHLYRYYLVILDIINCCPSWATDIIVRIVNSTYNAVTVSEMC